MLVHSSVILDHVRRVRRLCGANVAAARPQKQCNVVSRSQSNAKKYATSCSIVSCTLVWISVTKASVSRATTKSIKNAIVANTIVRWPALEIHTKKRPTHVVSHAEKTSHAAITNARIAATLETVVLVNLHPNRQLLVLAAKCLLSWSRENPVWTRFRYAMAFATKLFVVVRLLIPITAPTSVTMVIVRRATNKQPSNAAAVTWTK